MDLPESKVFPYKHCQKAKSVFNPQMFPKKLAHCRSCLVVNLCRKTFSGKTFSRQNFFRDKFSYERNRTVLKNSNLLTKFIENFNLL